MKKALYLFLSLYIISGCKDQPVIPDFCYNCTFSTLLNGQPWKAELYSSHFKFHSQIPDTLFNIIVEEIYPQDDFRDVLIISRIPYDTGVYVFDTISALHTLKFLSEFLVHKYEYDYALQEYSVIPDGESFIHVESLDKQTRKFRVSFHIKMSIPGGEHGTLYTSDYPKFITFDGTAKGQVYVE